MYLLYLLGIWNYKMLKLLKSENNEIAELNPSWLDKHFKSQKQWITEADPMCGPNQ